MNKRFFIIKIAAAIFAIAIVAGISIQCAKEKPVSKIRIGYLPVAAELPLFVAIEESYFKDVGIEFELAQVRQLVKLSLVFIGKICKSLHYKFRFGVNRAGGFSLSF